MLEQAAIQIEITRAEEQRATRRKSRRNSQPDMTAPAALAAPAPAPLRRTTSLPTSSGMPRTSRQPTPKRIYYCSPQSAAGDGTGPPAPFQGPNLLATAAAQAVADRCSVGASSSSPLAARCSQPDPSASGADEWDGAGWSERPSSVPEAARSDRSSVASGSEEKEKPKRPSVTFSSAQAPVAAGESAADGPRRDRRREQGDALRTTH